MGDNDEGGEVRQGPGTSDSLKYSQEITSPDQEPEREGRSLVTSDHEVIRRWAEERDAVPATVEGTEHDGHLGVLRFDFGGDDGDRLQHVDWDRWFETFDERRLNFIYQETRSDGSTIHAHEAPAAAYADIEARTLLATGSGSSRYFAQTGDALAAVMPDAERIAIARARHNAANTAPKRLVEPLIRFFEA